MINSFLSFLIEIWPLIAAPATGTTFYFLSRKKEKRKNIQKQVLNICVEIINNQFRLIDKKRGKYLPKIEDVELQLEGRIAHIPLQLNKYRLILYILIGIYDKASSADKLANQLKILEHLKDEVAECRRLIDDDDPSPPSGIKKLITKVTWPFNARSSIIKQLTRYINNGKNRLLLERPLLIVSTIILSILGSIAIFNLLNNLFFKLSFITLNLIVFMMIHYIVKLMKLVELIEDFVLMRFLIKKEMKKLILFDKLRKEFSFENQDIVKEFSGLLIVIDKSKYLDYEKLVIFTEKNILSNIIHSILYSVESKEERHPVKIIVRSKLFFVVLSLCNQNVELIE